MTSKKNPTRPVEAHAGFRFANLPECNANLSNSSIAVQKIHRRYGVSLPHAATIAELLGLGLQEARL